MHKKASVLLSIPLLVTLFLIPSMAFSHNPQIVFARSKWLSVQRERKNAWEKKMLENQGGGVGGCRVAPNCGDVTSALG